MLPSLIRNIHSGLVLCIFLSCFSSVSLAQEALQWKFSVGDARSYTLIQKNSMELDLGPVGNTSTEFVQTLDIQWMVKEVDENGSAELSQEIKRIRLEMDAPGQSNLTYDSNSEEEPVGYAAMIAPVFKSLTAAQFPVSMASSGEIIKFEVPQKLKDSLKMLPGAKMMGKQVTEEGFKNTIQQLMIVLPKSDDLQEGHQWTVRNKMENPILGTVTSQVTYTYKGSKEVDGQQYEIFEPNLEISFDAEDASSEFQASLLEQTSKGEILFDRTAGCLESSTLNQELTVQFDIGESTTEQKIIQQIELKRREADLE